jgi:hypothetical protein
MKKIVLLFFLVSLLAACQAEIPTLPATPTPTLASTTTQTPSPTPIPLPEALQNLPEGLQAIGNEDGSWSIEIVNGENVTLIPEFIFRDGKVFIEGEEVDINLADSIKVGENGNPIILGEAIENPTEEQARKISYYFDGQKWIIPEVWRNMRYTPELMKIGEKSVPAIIGVVSQESDQVANLAARLRGDIRIFGGDEIDHSQNLDLQAVSLFDVILSQKIAERIVVFPGAIEEETLNQANLTFIYLADGQIRQFQFLVRGQIRSEGDVQPLTEDLIRDNLQIGLRYYVNFVVRLNTSDFNETEFLKDTDEYCSTYGVSCNYFYHGWDATPFAPGEIRDIFYGPTNPVDFGSRLLVFSISKDK